MSDQTASSAERSPRIRAASHIKEVRYSLKDMMEEVKMERKYSALGRELVDATEISKMFANRKRKRKTK